MKQHSIFSNAKNPPVHSPASSSPMDSREYNKELREFIAELSYAEERERKSMASDLHDHIGQALSIIKLRLSELQGNAIFSGLDHKFNEIKKLLDQTISYTRTLTFEISPPVLYELGIDAAVEWLAEQKAEKFGIKINSAVKGSPFFLPDDIKITIFKVVRELLINAGKHSKAKTVNILIQWSAADITITIQDDGIGFDCEKTKTEALKNCCFGLYNVRERVRYIGGHCNISSAQGKGAKITIRIPIDTDAKGRLADYEN